MHRVLAIAKVTRFDSSVLVFLAMFVPLYARSHDVSASLLTALPLLFIAMCTYIANDLDDIERDKINHPARPLPSGKLTTYLAAALYFVCLTLALVTVRLCIAPPATFGYYTLLVLSISYGYIVDWLPGFKAPYVACALSVPIVLVTTFYPESRLYRVAASVFLLSLGREWCKDLVDRAGDARSFMHKLRPVTISAAAFLAQVAGLTLLASLASTWRYVLDFLLVTCIFISAGVCWLKPAKRELAIFLMKVQLLAGLYFLV